MKRFLAYSLILITLLAGVVSSTAFKSKPCLPVSQSTGHQQTIPNQHQSYFSSSDLFLAVGVNNEQIRLSNSLQNFSHRVLPSLLNAFRIQHSIQLTQQRFSTGTTVFLLNSANKQLDGYYLYHLRKLLI
ncbi:MAG: hypothetical protein PHT07_05730 [Paludibacter sp.]|nr:hypothetical protein [Paludibacter sp.]